MKIKPKAGGVVVELGRKEEQIPAAPALPIFKLNRILVPMDFTDAAEKAMQYAVPFAKQFGAQLYLLHVIEPYLPPSELAAYPDIETPDETEHQLQAMSQKIDQEVHSSVIVRRGNAAWEILAAIKELDVDLVILSTHGRRGLDRMLMGSTTEKVVRRASCPVLIVRENEHEFIANTPTDHATKTGTSV